MEIRDVETIEFTYESNKVRDEKGHSHPGEPHEARGTITRVVVEDGPDGYCPGGSAATNDLAADYLVGEDPREREAISQRLKRSQRLHKGSFADTNLARIDCALWDVAGKLYDEPVYRLLGGHREWVPAYGSTMVGDDDGLGSPEAYADFAADLVDRGYPAVKLHTWMPPYDASPERVIEACRAVRERVGPDVSLMLDSHHFYSRTEARRIGRALADLEFAWFEEPMDEHSISAYEWLTEEVEVPVVGPETAEGRHHTRAEWIKRGASDVSRVGIADVGGLTPALKTVHLCEAFAVPCEVHGANLPNLHLLAAMADSGEYYERGLLHPAFDYEAATPWLVEVPDPLDDDGRVLLPEEPGLGYEFDWEFVETNRIDGAD
ncbi:enolase C-terminal domain-like protein [Saliphagus infecundisoli]|uniref:Enolase C-terminal domain-like protein n=1 Tax=Saliphagus infecundisoli TaxID=1849069 RepID=A0ABD5QIH2_9EURY|nr:enolase C-terminal domain-like protein [Saliphagus infecundisoli]